MQRHTMSPVVQRVRALHHRHPWLGDLAALVIVLPLTLGPRAGDLEQSTAAHLFNVALTVPLLARRRWPVGVFGLIALVALAQWIADVRAVGDAALLPALYSVASTQPTRIAFGAWAVLEVGVAMAALRYGAEGANELHAVVGLSGLSVAAALMGVNTRGRRRLVASLNERAERLERERDQQGRISAAAERARIAREMHDIVAHNVSVMIALADGAGYAAEADPSRAAQAMDAVSRTGRQALAEMRRLLGVLRDEDTSGGELAPQPGLHEIDALVSQVRGAGLSVRYEVVGAPPAPLAPGLQLAVYRIVQEALTNTLKHAGPSASARLSIRHTPETLVVDVLDEGSDAAAGIVPASATSVGAGLRGMRERAAVYDGAIEAGPDADGRWRVRLTVPESAPAVRA